MGKDSSNSSSKDNNNSNGAKAVVALVDRADEGVGVDEDGNALSLHGRCHGHWMDEYLCLYYMKRESTREKIYTL